MTTRGPRLAVAGALALCVGTTLAYLSLDDGADPRTAGAGEPTAPATGPASSASSDTTEPPVGAVVGRVTGTDGSPLSGIRVTVLTEPFEARSTGPGKPMMPTGPTWTRRTDERGDYRVGKVTAGVHRLVFSAVHQGRATHATTYNGGGDVLADAPDLVVVTGGVTAVDAVLPEAARVAGVVRNAVGRPVAPGVPVVVLRVDTPSWTEVASTVTRPGGRYAVGALAAGHFVVRVDHRTSGAIFHPAATRPRAARSVVLDEGAQVTGVDVDLPGAGTVSGRALQPDGDPLAGVWVNIQSGLRSLGPYGSVPIAPDRVLTDAAGRYEFRQPTGRHQVWLELENPAHHCRGVHVDHVDVWVDGGRRTVQDLRMEHPVTIRGTVTDRAGRPLRGIEVASEQRLSCQVATRTDRHGRYALTGLSPGGHRIRFGAADHSDEYFTEYFGGGDRSNAPVLHLAPGEGAAGIDARLGLGGRIIGTVTLPADPLLQGVEVTAVGRPEPGEDSWVERTSTVAPNGRYEIVGLPTGTYRLFFWPSYATAARDQAEGVHYAAGGTSLDADDAIGVEVTQGRATTGVDLAMDADATIRGTVVDGDGVPRHDIQVVAYRRDPDSESGWREASSTWTGPAGHYVLRGLGAGSFRVGFAGEVEFFPEVTDLDEARDLEVGSGAVVRHIDAELVFEWD